MLQVAPTPPDGWDRPFERIAYVDAALNQVAVVDIAASFEDGRIYVWRVWSPDVPMLADHPIVMAGPFDSLWDGYQWAKYLLWPSSASPLVVSPRRSPARPRITHSTEES